MRPAIAAFFAFTLLAAIDYDRARRFWSFQPVKSVTPPAVDKTNPIDRFIEAKLAAAKIKPNPPADPATWLRRVTFDLTGLPPTPDEVKAFLAQPDKATARAKVVDRLLASPHYGERWARHWLDLVRYAETDGHEFDNDKPNAWRYRDYVIRAFNEDLPYNTFVREHIAGDLLPVKRLARDGKFFESPIATGWYWLGENKNSPVDPDEAIADRVDNIVDVFGKTFLGLTVACARCHDHKFDPIATRDYYSLAGYFHSIRRGQVAVEGVNLRNEPNLEFAGLRWTAAGPGFAVEKGVLTSGSVTDQRHGLAISSVFVASKRYLHVRSAGTGKITVSVDEFPQNIQTVASADLAWRAHDLLMYQGHPVHLTLLDTAADSHLTVADVLLSDTKAPPARQDARDAFATPPLRNEPNCEPSQFALAPLEAEGRDVAVHIRGSHKKLGEMAPRRLLPVIAGTSQPPVASGSGRLELAARLVDETNPLLARVMVNRLWHHHFGRGLVGTPDNFGLTGDTPSHPELLDWLAGEFVRGGWTLKRLHRLMVLSEAYGRSSTGTQEADPANRLLYKANVRRLEAEAIRDSFLAIAGSLDRTSYGPSVPVYVSEFMDGDPRSKPKSGPLDGASRRSIYINVRRNFLPDGLTVFDYPQPISTIGRRSASVVPSQALYLLNSEFSHLMASRWAAALVGRTGLVSRMYLEAFGRPASAAEVAAGEEFLRSHPLTEYAHVLLNTTEALFLR